MSQQLPPQSQPNIDQAIAQMRDQVSRSQSNAEYSALSSFDKLVEQLRVFANQLNQKNIEINRLEQLCTKNKVDYTIKPQPIVIPPNKISPPKSVSKTAK